MRKATAYSARERMRTRPSVAATLIAFGLTCLAPAAGAQSNRACSTDASRLCPGIPAAGVFGQDVYVFWQPLDVQFMQVANALARRDGVSVLSFYWSRQFFAYIPANEGGDSWRTRSQAENRASFTAMREGRLCQTGATSQELIVAP